MFDDQYGYPNEIRANKFLENTIKNYEQKGDTRGLSSFKRKNPRTFKEAFSADGEFALYNPEIINRQLDEISWSAPYTEKGDLEWEDGFRIKIPKQQTNGETIYLPSKIKWVSNSNGKFERVMNWQPKEPNKVFHRYGSFMPNNNFSIRIGCDPFKYDKTKDKRRSNCAAFAYQIPDALYPSHYDDMFVLRYSYREESTRQANEDILKMAWWCGCEVLFERNVNHWKNDFGDWECAGFLTWLPGEVEPGIITNGDSVQTICNYTEAYINQFIHNVYFKTLLRKETGWLGFKVEDTEKFDEPMAAGVTLINVKGVINHNKTEHLIPLTDYFRMRAV